MAEALGIVNLGVFLVGTVIIILAPGPNSLYVLATATRRGVRDGYTAACGVLVGDSLLMLLATLGVDSLFRVYPMAVSFIQYAGALYLAYLGLRILYATARDKGGWDASQQAPTKENPFKRALLLSLSNPKAILFFVSFFVQFVDPGKGHPGMAFLLLACIVQLVSITYLSFLIIGGARIAAAVRGNHALQRAGSALAGVAFVGFGCRLALKAATS